MQVLFYPEAAFFDMVLNARFDSCAKCFEKKCKCGRKERLLRCVFIRFAFSLHLCGILLSGTYV